MNLWIFSPIFFFFLSFVVFLQGESHQLRSKLYKNWRLMLLIILPKKTSGNTSKNWVKDIREKNSWKHVVSRSFAFEKLFNSWLQLSFDKRLSVVKYSCLLLFRGHGPFLARLFNFDFFFFFSYHSVSEVTPTAIFWSVAQEFNGPERKILVDNDLKLEFCFH